MRSFFLLIIIFSNVFYSCQPIYVVTAVNTPMLNNKGEMQAKVGFGTAGIDPQLSFAATDHFGLMLNGSFKNQEDGKHHFIEFGLGYFTKFNSHGRFELFSGYGGGKLSPINYAAFYSFSGSEIKFNRFFIQPAIGFSNNYIDANFSARIAFVNSHLEKETISSTFFEPAITFRTGKKYIKFFVQIGYSFKFKSEYGLYQHNHQPLFFSLGILVTFNREYD